MLESRLRVIVIHDNAEGGRTIQDVLGSSLDAEVDRYDCVDSACETIADDSPDVVVLCCATKASHWRENIARIQQCARSPVILVADENLQVCSVDVIREGADDCVPMLPSELKRLPFAVLRSAQTYRNRLREMSELGRMSVALTSCLDPDIVVAKSLDGVMALLDLDAAWMVLPDDVGTLELVDARGIAPEEISRSAHTVDGQNAISIELGKDVEPGFFCVASKRSTPLSARDRMLLTIIAEMTAGAVRTARLFGLISRAKEQWERAFDAISDPIFVCDDAFHIIRLNRAAARCFGMKPKDAIGKVCYELLNNGGGPCPWHEAVRRGCPTTVDCWLSHLSRRYSITVFPYDEDDGAAVGHVLRETVVDTTADSSESAPARAAAK